MAVLMKGSEVIASMKDTISRQAESLKTAGVTPCLAIVRLGARPDDLAYEKGAVKRCESLGVSCKVMEYDPAITQQQLVEELRKINGDPDIHGILIFRPLPAQIDDKAIRHEISPDKDVDCLSPANEAKVFEGDPSGFAPCTPEAVMRMLKHYGAELSGKRVTVVGRSLVVGKPLAMLLIKENATVTVCHTRTRDLEGVCRSAEILIAAAGKAKMIKASFVSEGQIVVDVGINMDENGNLCGDVDFDAAEKVAAYISPVPGGVGAVTSSVLAEHVVRAAAKLAAKRQ
jgi:methylenetetrahydrofolate dehydrogenase (NADP+)/methenyltetrahydrofolate cyclohydrolase